MGISHIISFIDNVTKFINSNLYFIAGKLRSFICQSQGHAKSNESQHETQAENFMTNSEDTDNYGDQTNKPVVEVNEKIICRSRFDIFMNSSPQSNANKRARDRAVSRIPTTVLKRVMEKSKKVRSTLRKHFQKSVPKSSRLLKYFNSKSIVYCRLI